MPDVTVRKTWPGIYPTTPIPLSELFRCVWYVVDIRDEELTHTSIKCIMRFGQSEGRMERVRFPVSGQRGDPPHGRGVRGLSAQRLLDLVDAGRDATRGRARKA